MWGDFSFRPIFFSSSAQTQHNGPQELDHDQVAVFCPFPFLLWSKRWQGVEERAVEFSAAKGHLKHLCANIKLTCKSLLPEQCGAYRDPSGGIWPAGRRMDHYSLEHQLFHHPGLNARRRNRILYMCILYTYISYISYISYINSWSQDNVPILSLCVLWYISLSSPFVFAICILCNFSFKIFLRRDHFCLELNNPKMHLCCLLAWR